MKLNTPVYALVTLSFIGLVFGQVPSFPPTVSQGCQTGIGGVLISLTCLPSTALIPLFSTTTANQSATSSNGTSSQISSAITTICSSKPCDDNATSSALSQLDSACSNEIANNEPSVLIVATVLAYFTPLYQGICSKDSSTGTYCGVESFPVFNAFISGGNNTNATLASIPKSQLCTNCTGNIIGAVAGYKPVNASAIPPAVVKQGTEVGTAIQSQCPNLTLSSSSNNTNSNPGSNSNSSSGSQKSSATLTSYPNGMYYAFYVILFIVSMIVL